VQECRRAIRRGHDIQFVNSTIKKVVLREHGTYGRESADGNLAVSSFGMRGLEEMDRQTWIFEMVI
jgi:hypothetical protein